MSLMDQVRKLEQQVLDRLKELEPLQREYEQLRKVAQRLGVNYSPGSRQSDEGARPATTARRASTRARAGQRAPRSAARTPPSGPRRRAGATGPDPEPRGGRSSSRRRTAAARPGQRQEEVLRLVGEKPGITVREIGERLRVDATGLYRVVNRLTEEGRVRKDGRGLHPVETGTTVGPAGSQGLDGLEPESPATATGQSGERTEAAGPESSATAGDSAASGTRPDPQR